MACTFRDIEFEMKIKTKVVLAMSFFLGEGGRNLHVVVKVPVHVNVLFFFKSSECYSIVNAVDDSHLL